MDGLGGGDGCVGMIKWGYCLFGIGEFKWLIVELKNWIGKANTSDD
jgi:hypothetical protein